MCGNDDVVTWCVGHLLEQAEPDAYDPGNSNNGVLNILPIIPEKWILLPRKEVKNNFPWWKTSSSSRCFRLTRVTRIEKGSCWWMKCLVMPILSVENDGILRCLISDLNLKCGRKSGTKTPTESSFYSIGYLRTGACSCRLALWH